MEKGLKEYVQMIAESKDIKLKRSQIKEIVNNLMECDEIWDVLSYYINDEINSIGGDE